jgi:hypothetical protein
MPYHAAELLTRGVTVVHDVIPEHSLRKVRSAFVKSAYNAPELRGASDSMVRRVASLDPTVPAKHKVTGAPIGSLVGGSFAALGNPSSFHHLTFRKMRAWAAHAALTAVFGAILTGDPTLAYQCVIDRIMVRMADQSPTAEGVHRDCPPDGDDDPMVVGTYGGWLALSDTKFVCVPATHNEPNDGKGFAVIKDADRKADYTRRLQTINVPAGSMVIFDERLVHAVRATKGEVSLRLFMGHRLVIGDRDLEDSVYHRIKTQAPIKMKSGQEPPMHPKLYRVNYPDKISELSPILSVQAATRGAMEQWTVKSGKRAGEVFKGPKREMPSLAKMGLPLHAPYSRSELHLLCASRGPWHTVVDGTVIGSYTLPE